MLKLVIDTFQFGWLLCHITLWWYFKASPWPSSSEVWPEEHPSPTSSCPSLSSPWQPALGKVASFTYRLASWPSSLSPSVETADSLRTGPEEGKENGRQFQSVPTLVWRHFRQQAPHWLRGGSIGHWRPPGPVVRGTFYTMPAQSQRGAERKVPLDPSDAL